MILLTLSVMLIVLLLILRELGDIRDLLRALNAILVKRTTVIELDDQPDDEDLFV